MIRGDDAPTATPPTRRCGSSWPAPTSCAGRRRGRSSRRTAAAAPFATCFGAIGRGYRQGTPNGDSRGPRQRARSSAPRTSPGWTPTTRPARPRRDTRSRSRPCGTRADVPGRGSTPAGPWGALAAQASASIWRLYVRGGVRGSRTACTRPPACRPTRPSADDALRPNQLLAITLGAVDATQAVRRDSRRLRRAARAGRDPQPGRPARHAAAPRRAQRPAAQRPDAPVLGPVPGRRGHAAQACLPQRHRLDLAVPVLLRGLGHATASRAGRPPWRCSRAASGSWTGCVGHVPEIVDGDAPHAIADAGLRPGA